MGSKVQGNEEGPLKPAYSPLRPDLRDTVGAAGQWGAMLSVHSMAGF